MLKKRLTHMGSTLRSRTYEDKANIIQELQQDVWPKIETGAARPLVFETFPLESAGAAHVLIDSGTHVGKILLKTRFAA